MSTKGDKRTFRNEDLILKVTENIDPKIWDEGKYEAFLDELCGYREYQKEAIRTTLSLFHYEMILKGWFVSNMK